MVLATIVGVCPFLDWYRVDVPNRQIGVDGVTVAGELWTLPVLAAVMAALGIAMAIRPDRTGPFARWIGWALAAAGAFALGLALKTALDVRAVAVPVDVAAGPDAPLRAQPVAFIAAAAAAAAVASAMAWLRAGSA